MLNLALITSRYWPESSPGAKRAVALATSLHAAGHRVTVITQEPHYPDPAAFAAERQGRTRTETDPAGNTVWRFAPKIAAKDDLVRRLTWEARFALLASRARRELRDLDGVITSVPFVFNVVAARTFRCPAWIDLRDLTWEYTRILRSPLPRAGMRSLRAVALAGFRAAQGVSTTSIAQRQYLIENGVSEAKVRIVPNGVSRAVLDDLARRGAAPRADGPLRVVYAGLLGYLQGLGPAVDAFEGMERSEAVLHLYGDGVDRASLAERCRARGLERVRVHGHVPYDGYLDALASADVLLATLRPEAATSMPSKLLEYLAAGKPVLFAGDGEGAEVVREAGAGLVAPYGDAKRLQGCLRELASDEGARRQMGESGRRWVERHRVREQIHESWVHAIEDAIEGRLAAWGPVRPFRRLASAVVQGAERSGFLRFLERSAAGRSDRLAVVTYHRIERPGSRPRSAPGTLSATPEEFALQMEFLARHYRVIGMGDLLELFRKDRPLPPRSVLLTFDDAYTDFAEHAWPVLKRAGLPVTLFVPTAFPDRPDRTFWWDRLFQTLAASEARRVETPLGPLQWSSFRDRVRTFRYVREVVKRMPHRAGMELVGTLCDRLGDGHETPRVLNWDSLRTLAREGVVLGSHTRNHPMMDRISLESAREEIVGSLEDLKRETGSAAPVLAYPAGRFDPRVARIASESGIELAFTTDPGLNELRRSDRLRLRRVHVGIRTGLAGLRAQLVGIRPPV
jgi:glycosyltransferase involved in cell wall biosynthesis/peptidoglycan/xylan/chitin deacetylase (PgdA/CDA1 family)